MSLNQIWIHVVDTLREHFVKVLVGFLLMIVGWYFGRVRAREHWRKQEFLARISHGST